MFKCYQCATKRKEKERVFVGMNICGPCSEQNCKDAMPHCKGLLWTVLPRYVSDQIKADTDKVLHKEMYGY